VALWLVLGARYRVDARAPSWTRASSPHFEVYTTGGERRAREALTYFEQVRGFFEMFLSLPPTTRRPTRVILFSNASEYAPYRISAAAAAYEQPGRDRDYIVMYDLNGDSEPIIVHEYAHLALERSGGASYPVWLSEGLAEFFSTMEPAKDRVVLGRAPLGRLRTIQSETLLSVSRLIGVGRDSPEYTSDHVGMFYAQSWALTHMLVAGERYQPKVDQFLALVARGTSVSESLTRVFRKSVAEIDTDLRQYLTRGYFRELAVPYAAKASTINAVVAPIDTFDAHLALADLLGAGRGREAAARTAFEALAAERPSDPTMAATRGLFELQTGHTDQAQVWLERAVTGGSREPMAYAELARLVEPSDVSKAAALLDIAATLAPDDILIRIRIASNLVTRHRADDAMAMLGRIPRVPTEQQFLYHQVVANAYALLGQFAEARAAAARVAEFAQTASERRFAETMLRQVSGPPDMTDVVLGRLRNMQCESAQPVLEVQTSAGMLRLIVDAPGRIVVPGGGAAELSCGPQDRALRVGYARANSPSGTQGRVRMLDFSAVIK